MFLRVWSKYFRGKKIVQKAIYNFTNTKILKKKKSFKIQLRLKIRRNSTKQEASLMLAAQKIYTGLVSQSVVKTTKQGTGNSVAEALCWKTGGNICAGLYLWWEATSMSLLISYGLAGS